jgi:hypothetical protein
VLERFERLAALRGDAQKGLPGSAWQTNLNDCDADLLLKACIVATRELILADWTLKRPDDKRPHDALDAAEAWVKDKSPDNLANAKTAAKACTAARSETFGTDHRIPEAARACAWACGAKDNEHIWEALSAIEQELLARIHLVADYHRVPEMRKNLLAVLRRVIEPPKEVAAPVDTGPVAYSASGNFVVGQKLTHAKFGDLVVTAAGDKWIDVQLPDGTTKRLAQKPK